MATQLPLYQKHGESRYSRLRSWRKVALVVLIIIGLMVILRPRRTLEEAPAGAYTIEPLHWPMLAGNNRSESAFSTSMFTTEALAANRFKPVTAVILRVTNDDETVVRAVHRLLKYHFIKEIYVYNTMLARPLHISHFNLDAKLHGEVNVETFEASEEPLGTLARFTYCSMAQYEHCFFQDDTWVNSYLDSLYTNFLRYPDLVHASTEPSRVADQLRWRFRNKTINMHAGYASLHYGAFVPRWKAQTFLTQLSKTGIDKNRIKHADHYFSIWTNQYPWIYSTPIQHSTTSGDEHDIAPYSRHYTYDASRHLQMGLELLASGVGMDYFNDIEDKPPLHQRDVQAPCGNDKCLFTTNMDLLHHIPEFHSEKVESLLKWEELYSGNLEASGDKSPLTRNFHYAVDQSPQTCWIPAQTPKAGDYFGLLMVGSVTAEKITLYGHLGTRDTEAAAAADLYEVSVLERGSEWVSCKTSTLTTLGSSIISIKCPGVEVFRAIRIAFTRDPVGSFELCGLEVGDILV